MPVTTKAGRQPPKCAVRKRTSAGATAAPTDEPLSNSATAQPRSRRGNHSETAFVAPGQLAASPAPSRKRKPQKLRSPVASDVSTATLEYHSDREREAVARADAVEHAARDGLHHRVRDAEGDDDQREVLVRPVELGLEVRAEDAQRLPVDVVDDGRERTAGRRSTSASGPSTRRPPGDEAPRPRSGSAARAVPPRPSVLRAPQAAPSRRHSTSGAPCSQRCRKPALKESPAPVVSTGLDRDRPGRATRRPPSSVMRALRCRAWPRRACGRSRARAGPPPGPRSR